MALRPIEGSNMRLMQMLRYLRLPFASNVKPGNKVLILTDTEHDPLVWQAAAGIVHELGGEPTVVIFPPRPVDYYDPPEPICKAMLESDINVFLTTTALFHSKASHASMVAGIPSIVLDGGTTADMWTTGAVTADYVEIARLKHVVGMRVFGKEAKTVRVTSRYGTDITYSVEGRVFISAPPGPGYDPYKAWSRKEEGRENSPLYGVLFPGGEFNVPPVEGTANGKIVVDTCMHNLGRITEPVHITIEAGRITKIEGGYQARQLEELLQTYGDENAWQMPTEASVGINPAARVTGIQREDKNFFGSVHFGLGTNSDVGGTVLSNLHMDGVILEPTVYVDGVMKIKEGRFLIDLG